MYQVDPRVQRSTEKAVERRRSAEESRKSRIFNTRLRVMGLDVDALDLQVQERKRLESLKKQQDHAFDKLRDYHDRVLLLQDTDEKNKQAVSHMGLAQYWATHQRMQDSRDADLKCNLKGACKLTIPESELGPSSMHIFQGEGIGEEQKRKEQMKERKRDLLAQMDENERKHMGNKHRDMLTGKMLVKQDLKLAEQAALDEDRRKEARVAVVNYNQALAVDQAEKLKEQHRREEQQNVTEMLHILTCDMMTECAEGAQREGGGENPDRWKGMSREQLNRIHREQEEQRLQRQRQRDTEKFQDALWDLHSLKLSKKAEEEEQRSAELRRELRGQMDQYNRLLARQQQAHQEFLNKKLYTNKPTKDFFSQFNTSSR